MTVVLMAIPTGAYPMIDFPQHAETFKIEAADAQADLGPNGGAN